MKEQLSELDYVLVRNTDDGAWRLAQYTHFEDNCIAVLGGNVFVQWKPYRNNRRLLGTTEAEWHRNFKFKVGDRVKLYNGVAEGTVNIVFQDEEFENHPYRINWDNGTFGFYDEDEIDLEDKSLD